MQIKIFPLKIEVAVGNNRFGYPSSVRIVWLLESELSPNPSYAAGIQIYCKSINLILEIDWIFQQTTAETDFGGVVYSSPTDGTDEVSTDHDSGSQQLMTPHRVRQLRQELAKTSVSGAAARDAFQRRSESLVKRLDAKKTMAEISIPVEQNLR